MASPFEVAAAQGWRVTRASVMVPLGQRRHAVQCTPTPDGWAFAAEVPQPRRAGAVDGLLQRNRFGSLAWFGLDRDGSLRVQGAAPSDADREELVLLLLATARLADAQEREEQEEDRV